MFTALRPHALRRCGVLLSCLALVGAGCGDGDGETKSTAGANTTPTSEATPSTTSPRASSRDADASASPSAAPEKRLPAPKRVPVEVPKSGDSSIQTFGDAASAEDYEAIATTVRLYNIASAESDEAAMCEQLAPATVKSMVTTLEKLAEKSSSPPELDCESVLETMLRQPGSTEAAQLRDTRVTDARIDGDSGFAIVRVRGLAESAVSVRREDGEWKVAGLSSVPLT